MKIFSFLSPFFLLLQCAESASHSWGKKSAFGVNEMAWALRLTGEVNRQLVEETYTASSTISTERKQDRPATSDKIPSSETAPVASPSLLLVRGGSDVQTKQPLSHLTTHNQVESDAPLTIFHAKAPLHSEQTGAARWGPCLSSFVQHALKVLAVRDEQDQERILLLSLLFMDRASSVSTPRSQESSHPLPFCMPRTVHRLTLASMILAASSHSQQQQQKPLSTALLSKRMATAFGLCPEQLHSMVMEMKHALGDFGAMVTPAQYEQFQQAWMSSPVLRQLLQSTSQQTSGVAKKQAV